MAVGLIVPEDRAFCETFVCGLPLLTRAVCTFGRAAGVDTVYILKTPAVPDGYPQELEEALAARSARPRVVWLDQPSAIPPGRGLFVLARPGVFDHKLCAAIAALPDTGQRIVRCPRTPDNVGLLWYVGPQRAPAFIESLQRPDTPAADWLDHQPSDNFDPGGRLCHGVDDERSQRTVERLLYAATHKMTDTWIARHFDRHISAWITSHLLPHSVTPTQVTIIAFALGILGALTVAIGSHAASIIGSALLVLSIIVDGCDGEIARLKFLETPSGRKLDFVLDNVVNALALFTVGIGHYFTTGSHFFLYAPLVNAVAALTSAVPVYFLYYQKESEPAGTKTGPKSLGTRVTEAVNGRDFMYLIFILALFDRVYWFVYLTLGGIGFFLASVLFMFVTRHLGLRPARAVPVPQVPPVQVGTAVDHPRKV